MTACQCYTVDFTDGQTLHNIAKQIILLQIDGCLTPSKPSNNFVTIQLILFKSSSVSLEVEKAKKISSC